jgi:uncharacterized membrane protein YraQ (UPF0718 family)
MELALELANNFLTLLDAFAIYVLIGLFIAGVLKQIVPDDFVAKHLGKDSTRSVVKATLFGIPLPVCSCSVIPLAQGLRKEGASKGAVQSFLISTPITGVDSILATFSLFGWFFTFFRLFSSIIIAISVGLVQNIFENKEDKKNTQEPMETAVDSCCTSSTNNGKKSFSFKAVFTYGYGTLMQDMAKALLIGLILGALFITFMPEEYSKVLFENQILTYIVVMLFAMPLYTCATASLPIAAALMSQGMSAGAVFIFLTAGPATSAVTMSVVYKMLGKRALIIYLSVIGLLGFLFGWGYDTFFEELSVLKLSMEHEGSSFIESLASFIMLLLMIFHIVKQRVNKKEQNACCTSTAQDNNTSCCSSSVQEKASSCCTPSNSFTSHVPNNNQNFKLKP